MKQTIRKAHSTPPHRSFREVAAARVESQLRYEREQAVREQAWRTKFECMSANENACGGDPSSVNTWCLVIHHLGHCFRTGRRLTRATPGMQVKNRPDHALMRKQAEYRVEQLARTSRAYMSTATDCSPGPTVMSDPDPVTEPVRCHGILCVSNRMSSTTWLNRRVSLSSPSGSGHKPICKQRRSRADPVMLCTSFVVTQTS